VTEGSAVAERCQATIRHIILRSPASVPVMEQLGQQFPRYRSCCMNENTVHSTRRKGGVVVSWRMTWVEAKQTYPDEWVAFVDYVKHEGFVSEGTVIAHSPERKAFYAEEKKLQNNILNSLFVILGSVSKIPNFPFYGRFPRRTRGCRQLRGYL
jgi:hypothetical protein